MDILTGVVPGTNPAAPAQQIYITLNGTAQDLEGLLMCVQRSLVEGPQIFETRTLNGTPLRILIDRLGPPAAKGA